MNRPSPPVASVRWSSVFPWLVIILAARVSVMIRVIALALIGVAATYGGWRLIDASPLGNQALADLEASPPLLRNALVVSPQAVAGSTFERATTDLMLGPLATAWRWVTSPFMRLPAAHGWPEWLALALAGAWALAVWALFGGAIARIAGVHLTYGETLGPVAALRASARRWPSTVAAPLLVALAAAIVTMPLAAAGLLLRSDLMTLVLGLAWAIVLLAGAVTAILAVGLAFGWPFMFATVAVERTDAFDAISRAMAYLFQRPLHLLFYVVVASLIGFPAQAAVELGVEAIIAATQWGVGVGAGEERLRDLGFDGAGVNSQLGDVGALGATGMHFWTSALRAAAAYFPLAYFWPAVTAIYLLQRRHVDATEMTDVEFDEGETKPGLPPLATDAATGVPQVDRPQREQSSE
jgi:hypothetical protein